MVLPEDGVGSPVFLINRISFFIDGERRDPLDQGQGVDLVHAVQVGLGELVVLHVGEVVPEPGEEGHQVVEGEKVELDSGGPVSPLLVPGSLQVLDGGRSVNTETSGSDSLSVSWESTYLRRSPSSSIK